MRTLIFLILVACVVGACFAYVVPERPLEKRIADADVVFIGTVTGVAPDPGRNGYFEFATFHVNSVLKGDVGPSVRLVSVDSIHELSPGCCVVGHTYLVIGKRTAKEDLLRSVDGRFGVFDVAAEDGKAGSLTWPGATFGGRL